jgi:hypothetical protein
MGALVMLTLNQHHARPTRYRMASAMLYAHEACFLASLPALQPDPRARPPCLPAMPFCAGEMFPVTRGLQVVSMSVGPRYSRAVLVK